MGRADLSRHRKSSPSDTRPIQFPSQLAWVLPKLSDHPHLPIARAINTIDSASTQRAQVQAVKLLGISLRDAHVADGQKHPTVLKCACTLPRSDIIPICSLAVPVLLALLFDTPAATAGLTSASLRAVLTCSRVGVAGIDEAVQAFVARVAGWKERDAHADDETSDDVREDEWFLQAAADVSALAVVLAEQQSRNWVLDKEDCVLGALGLICDVADLYRHTATADHSRPVPRTDTATISEVEDRISMSINRSMLEAACDSSMKAAQDIINCLLKLPPESEKTLSTKRMKAVARATISCERVLELPMAPRNCSMACSVAYVSGILFQCARDGAPKAVTRVLRENVLSRLDRFPPFSQLSLLRGVMESQAAKPAVPFLLFPLDIAEGEARDRGSVFDLLASITTENADVHLRFLAMDALIVCLRRRAPEKLSAYCRNVVLKLVYERWQEPFPGVSFQIRETMEALVAVDGGDEEATSFWLSMGRSLVMGDWHSKGIYAPLNVLVKRLGALRLLDAEHNCQSLALHAAGTDSRLAKPASDWLAMFWTVLWKECLPATTRFYELSNKDLLTSLVDECNTSLRERTTEYMLPAYLRAVGQENIEDTANALLNCLETISPHGSSSRIRGTICIMSAARQCGVFIGSFSDHGTCNLLQQALRSGLEDLRSSALDLIVTSRVSTEPISEEEIDLVRSYLPSALMPGGSPADRSRFRHSMRRFMERLAACRHAARDGSGGWWMRERKEKYNGLRTVAFEKQRTDLLIRIAAFEHDCMNLLLSSAYPGAPFTRMTNSLEVMLLVSKNLSCRTSFPSVGRQAEASVTGVVVCLLDEWERPRRSALQVLTSLDDPLAGFEAIGKVKELQMFALPLLDSPRQKDVDSGASVFRCIFRKHVLRSPEKSDSISPLGEEFVQESLHFCHKNDGISHSLSPIHMSPGLAYASSVLDSLETSAGLADEDFMGSCARGLFHGRCLLLRYIVQDLPWKELSSPSNFDGTRQLVRRFLDLYWRCTRIAIDGVSFQSFDQMHDDPHDNISDNMDRADNILLNERKQLVSTSSFLSVKEICVSLGILCHEVPFANVAGVDECHGILTFEQISSVVELFRFVFTSTRHWGVIDGASEGLQLLCERLLQTSSARLRALPSQLVANCISSALSGELYVLRRSAGIPALFSAILNAEAAGHSRCHETPLLHRVVTDLLQHLQTTNMYTDETTLLKSRSQEEESVAHALNLLRSMFLNGNIASSILKYLESATMSCINAFCSASWLIRNSAMMLFSALVRRGIGVCVERRSSAPLSSFEVAGGTSATLDGERRLRGVTAFQFFSRHSKLHPFLLQQLQTALGRFEYHNKCDHPALFPTLYLLSSLSPAAAEDPTALLSMAPFRAVLRKCLHWRSNYVRRAAAAASVPLIDDPSHVAGVVEEYLCTGVPPEPDIVCRGSSQISDMLVSNGEVLTSPEPRVSRLVQNRLHGELLAIAAVLKGMSRTMSSVDKLNTVRVLVKHLPSRAWIAKDGHLNPCSVTRASMLVVLGRSYELARDVRNTSTITDKDPADADFVLSLCKKIALELDENEVGKDECGMDVGLSSFLRNAAKLLGLVTVSSFENDETSLGDAVQSLSKLVFSTQREAIHVGLDSAVQLLECDAEDRNSADEIFKVWSPDVRNSLHRLWDRGAQILSSLDDQELLIGALRMLTTILASYRKYGSDFADLSVMLTSEKLISILQMAESHACVDVREHAIVLAGQLVCVTELKEKLVLEWISLIENATTSGQPPTTRIAASTSFENSGFGRLREPGRVGVAEEVTVRGFLVLAHLLHDENVEIRTHVVNIVYQCKGTSGVREAFPSDILPSLMWIYDLLSTRFSSSRSFSQHMQDLLAVSDDKLQFNEQERLTRVIQLIVTAKSSEEASRITSKVQKVTVPSSNKKKQRLFRLEDDACDTEVVVRLQLVAWSYRKIILGSASNCVPHNVKAQLCTDLISALRNDVVQGTRQSGTGIIGGDVFTSDGFRRCYRSTLRLLLGIACLQATSPDVRRDMLEAQSSLSKQLTEVIVEFGEVVHATLLSVFTGIRNLLNDGAHSDAESNLQKVFFLLQI